MSIKLPNFQPVKYPAHRHSIGGTTADNLVAKRGQIVTYGATGDTIILAATGTSGYFLTRDIMLEADLKAWHDANELRPNKQGFITPFLAGQPVQAEDLKEIWVEGEDLLHSSMDDVAVGQRVSTNGGKFATLTNSETQECIGIVRSKVAALNAESGYRYLIEIVRAPKNIPAA
jgi:hypothetical protein